MTNHRRMGSEALAKLESLVSRRTLLRTGATGAAGLGLAALTGHAAPGRARAAQDAVCGGEAATLTYGFWDAAQRPAVEAQIEAFRALNPNITIEPQVVPFDDYWTKLQTGLAGGSIYDVFWVNTSNLPVYASQGAILPIEPILGEGGVDVGVYPEALVNAYTFDGTVYGIPRDFDTIALFYNTELFDTAGVAYPTADWTWEDLRTAAEALTVKDGDTATQWGFGATISEQQTYFNFIKQNGGQILNEDLTEALLDEPAACEALAFVGDFIEAGLSPSVAVQQANDPYQTLFPAGVIAMIPGGSWNARTFSEANPAIAVAPLPMGTQRASAIHGLANVIWAQTANQCAALEWVKFLAGEEAERILGETGTVIPAMAGLQEGWVASVPEMDLQVFLDAVDYSFELPSPPVGDEWSYDLEAVLIEAWSGGIPRDEVCVRADEVADAALAAD